MTNIMFNENISVLYQTRYCAQEDFSIAVSMNGSIKRLEYPFTMISYKNSKQIDTLITLNSKVVACGSVLFLIGESRRNCTIEKYSEIIKNSIVLPSLLDKRIQFCVCSFMQKIYVVGGYIEVGNYTINSCMCYDIKSNKWTYIASIMANRQNASCAVFKGKIVVTGGYLISDRPYEKRYRTFSRLNSSESYCFHEEKWTQFSDMLQGRIRHGTVSIGNKLLVIGGDYENTCEVLDGTTNKFALIKSLPKFKDNLYYLLYNIEAVRIGYKIYVFREMKHRNKKDDNRSDMLVYSYNDEQNACIQENNLQLQCKVLSCAKISKT